MYKLEQILISIFLLLFGGSGLFVYLIVIRVLMTKFSKKSYFILASWLGIADCTFLIVTVCYVVPSILKGKLLYNSNMFGGIINIAWFSGLPIMLLLAGDRYLCMCHYKIHARIYSLSKTKIYCVLSWLFGISCGIPSFFSGCTLYYNMKIMSWRWDTDHYCATILSYVEISMVLGIVGVTCILTVLVLRFLQRTRTSLVICTTQLKRQVIRERKIFSQFIIITTCFLVFDTSLIVISYLNSPSKWFGLFVSTAYILNCSVNGWVYLSMNQFIRGEVRRMFQRMLRKRNSKIDSDEYKVKQATVLEIV